MANAQVLRRTLVHLVELTHDQTGGIALIEAFISLYLFLVGAVFGSFATLVGERVVDGQSIVRPASRCNHCQTPLRPWHLVPVVSWILLGGRCSVCHTRIPMRYPAQELLLGTAVVLSFWHHSDVLLSVASCLLWFVLVIAVSTDLRHLIVPNWLTYPSCLALYALCAVGEGNFVRPLLGMVVGFVMIFAVHLISGGKMGLGDAKLYLSIGAVLGAARCVESFVLACLFGAVVGILLRWTGRLERRQFIPFVPFIVMGVACANFLLSDFPDWYLHHVLRV